MTNQVQDHAACARRVEDGYVHYSCGISVEQGDYEGGVYDEHRRRAARESSTPCLHENVRVYRSFPPHAVCLDCGLPVEQRWIVP